MQWKQRIQIAQQLWFEIHLWDDLTWTIDYDANETSPLTHDCVATDQSPGQSPSRKAELRINRRMGWVGHRFVPFK